MENNLDRSRWNGLRPLDIVGKNINGIVTGFYKVIFLLSDEERVQISIEGSSQRGEIVYSTDLSLIDKVDDYAIDKSDIRNCCCE